MAVRLMSYMGFPDDEKLRTAAEVTFRTKLADWFSETFAKERAVLQRRFLRAMEPVLGDELPGALANPSAWMRNRFFNDFLESAGGIIRGAVALTESPSAEDMKREWTQPTGHGRLGRN